MHGAALSSTFVLVLGLPRVYYSYLLCRHIKLPVHTTLAVMRFSFFPSSRLFSIYDLSVSVLIILNTLATPRLIYNHIMKKGDFTMQPTIELEICSYPAGTENPTERFVRGLISEARKPAGEHQWKRLQAPKEGFSFRDANGSETILTKDFQDEEHVQYSLHGFTPEGDAFVNGIEWVSTGREEESDLHILYTILEEKLPATPAATEDPSKQQFVSGIAERLVDALTVDARNLKSINWLPQLNTGQKHCSYHADGTSPGSRISIIPDSIGDDFTTFTFVYEVNGQEIISSVETAPVEAHSALRDLYYAVAGKDICEEDPELMRIARFISSLREKDFLDRVLKDDFPQQPAILVWDIFKRCNARAVCGAYARTIAKEHPDTEWTVEKMNQNFSAASQLINRIRAIRRCPNGKSFTEKMPRFKKSDPKQWDTATLDTIANSGCTILSEFYCGLSEKCAINRTAHLLLVSLLSGK